MNDDGLCQTFLLHWHWNIMCRLVWQSKSSRCSVISLSVFFSLDESMYSMAIISWCWSTITACPILISPGNTIIFLLKIWTLNGSFQSSWWKHSSLEHLRSADSWEETYSINYLHFLLSLALPIIPLCPLFSLTISLSSPLSLSVQPPPIN